MIRYFCDRCGDESNKPFDAIIDVVPCNPTQQEKQDAEPIRAELCGSCARDLRHFIGQAPPRAA